jgi:hypothetical protein
MSYKLKVYFDNGYLDLIAPEEINNESLEDLTDFFVRGIDIQRTSRTSKIVSFEAFMFDQDYKAIMEDLTEHPIPVLYDVPELGLKNAPITKVLAACYKTFVLPRLRQIAEQVAGGSGQ